MKIWGFHGQRKQKNSSFKTYFVTLLVQTVAQLLQSLVEDRRHGGISELSYAFIHTDGSL